MDKWRFSPFVHFCPMFCPKENRLFTGIFKHLDKRTKHFFTLILRRKKKSKRKVVTAKKTRPKGQSTNGLDGKGACAANKVEVKR